MRLVSLSSGSNGNCIYVGNDHTHILVDTGISGKKTEEGLNSQNCSKNTACGSAYTVTCMACRRMVQV